MKIFAALFFLLSTQSKAAIWVRASDTSPQEFREYVARDPDGQTVVQFELAKRRQEDPTSEELRWAQTLLEQTSVEGIHARLDAYLATNTMTERRRIFLIDLLVKVREKARGNTRKEIDQTLCQWAMFPNSSTTHDLPVNCAVESASLDQFRIRNPQFEVIVVEDFEIQMKDGAVAPVNPDKEYNWFLLSNAVTRVSYRGTLKELEQKALRTDALVQGNCDSFTQKLDDLELVSRGRVYFSSDCQRELRTPETSRIGKWYEENRPLAWTIGAVAVGVIAMGLKNKRVVIEKPSFR